MTLKGKVWVHPKYTAAKQGEAAKGRSTLASFETAFKDYWTTGFHPHLVKTPFLKNPFLMYFLFLCVKPTSGPQSLLINLVLAGRKMDGTIAQ